MGKNKEDNVSAQGAPKAPQLTIPRNAAIEGGDSETGHHFHYSRAERLKLSDEDCPPDQLPKLRGLGKLFAKNRGLMITFIDIGILVVLVILFLTILKPNLAADSLEDGSRAHLEGFVFQDEVFATITVEAETGTGTESSSLDPVGIGFFLFSEDQKLPERNELRSLPGPSAELETSQTEPAVDSQLSFSGPVLGAALEAAYYRDLLPTQGSREFSARLPLPALALGASNLQILGIIWVEGSENIVILTTVGL